MHSLYLLLIGGTSVFHKHQIGQTDSLENAPFRDTPIFSFRENENFPFRAVFFLENKTRVGKMLNNNFHWNTAN